MSVHREQVKQQLAVQWKQARQQPLPAHLESLHRMGSKSSWVLNSYPQKACAFVYVYMCHSNERKSLTVGTERTKKRSTINS